MIKHMLVVLLAAGVALANGSGRIKATEFSIEKGFYQDRGKWLAVNPNQDKDGEASLVFPYRDGTYDVVLEMVGENDGQSSFEVLVESKSLGKVVCPPSKETFEEGAGFHRRWSKVAINDGDIVRVKGFIASADGKEWSRARWAALAFAPVDGGASLAAKASATPNAETGAIVVPLHGKRGPDGDGAVEISGELKTWHKVTLTLDGPFAHELDNQPNPFIDRRMDVTFVHESGSPEYVVPGYFAADGNAGETSAECGTKWRAHLSPDKAGKWNYAVSFKGTAFDGKGGSFEVGKSDKTGRDLRGKGRLQYVGGRYLRFADSGEWFLKAGADAPETLLGYADFDNTVANKPKVPLKTFSAHANDWAPGDPSWKGGKGKGLIGAVNYLSSTGANAFSFLTYNAGGDGDNVWPHVARADKLHFDCSKLDQWGIVFDHGTAKGMYLHFKLQETENDDKRGKNEQGKLNALDGGRFGKEREAYLREMIARFGHNLALNWNMGEENTQKLDELEPMAAYIRKTDPYGHNLVLHTYPNQQDEVYGWFVGRKDMLTGLSIQNSDVAMTHTDTLKWVTRSEASGHPWIVAFDEAGNAGAGSPPDPDWPGMAEALVEIAKGKQKLKVPSVDDVRTEVLWGTLMAGGTGVEYYFGYRLPENDLLAENWRSREMTWRYSRIALDFFRDKEIPFWEMANANALIGNEANDNSGYCLAKAGECYVAYLRNAEGASLDLTEVSGSFAVQWFNPREGGPLQKGSVKKCKGGRMQTLGLPPSDPGKDWVVIVRK
ncbi:hypothetical protein PDESU_03057 [Pontiella desulfatans]|uniref:DUF5060 domain-containing protein n=1 Tax=Pontiella desulfatans TaxID=2750659 RepID=A0A6C2U3P4_PONDE|nr:DUF5060 domain-containing protein [Pontiella desulfatans]VGO14495.1 hypothetical protein PDESU_03057 [Pontiella desulfatans]